MIENEKLSEADAATEVTSTTELHENFTQHGDGVRPDVIMPDDDIILIPDNGGAEPPLPGDVDDGDGGGESDSQDANPAEEPGVGSDLGDVDKGSASSPEDADGAGDDPSTTGSESTSDESDDSANNQEGVRPTVPSGSGSSTSDSGVDGDGSYGSWTEEAENETQCLGNCPWILVFLLVPCTCCLIARHHE